MTRFFRTVALWWLGSSGRWRSDDSVHPDGGALGTRFFRTVALWWLGSSGRWRSDDSVHPDGGALGTRSVPQDGGALMTRFLRTVALWWLGSSGRWRSDDSVLPDGGALMTRFFRTVALWWLGRWRSDDSVPPDGGALMTRFLRTVALWWLGRWRSDDSVPPDGGAPGTRPRRFSSERRTGRKRKQWWKRTRNHGGSRVHCIPRRLLCSNIPLRVFRILQIQTLARLATADRCWCFSHSWYLSDVCFSWLLLMLCVFPEPRAQIITLSDLECDYINARSCCSKLNKVSLGGTCLSLQVVYSINRYVQRCWRPELLIYFPSAWSRWNEDCAPVLFHWSSVFSCHAEAHLISSRLVIQAQSNYNSLCIHSRCHAEINA